MSGQAIVETALVMPIVLFLCLGMIEAGFLLTQKVAQDRQTAVVAEWAASHPGDSWAAVASRELPGCEISVTQSFRDLITAKATCHYDPRVTHGLWDGLSISSSEDAAVAPSRGAP